jgi:hypothetical protein
MLSSADYISIAQALARVTIETGGAKIRKTSRHQRPHQEWGGGGGEGAELLSGG